MQVAVFGIGPVSSKTSGDTAGRASEALRQGWAKRCWLVTGGFELCGRNYR